MEINKPWTVTRTFPDIFYTVRMRPFSGAAPGKFYVVDFEVYGVVGTQADDTVLWHKDGADCSAEWSEDGLNDAEWYMRGSLKWDGCVNYDVNQNECMLHECGPGSFEDHAMLWRWIFLMSRELMPQYSWGVDLVLPTGRVIEHEAAKPKEDD